MLHVLVGYVLGAQVVEALKCALGRPPKLDMFWWVVGFEVFVLRFMFRGVQFLIGRNECWSTTKTQHVFVSVCLRAPIAYM
jgi:hypothetical protein